MRIAKMSRHASGQWRVRICGKCHYLGSNKAEAEQKYRELVLEKYGPTNFRSKLSPDGITVYELLTKYIADRLSVCAPQWHKKKQQMYEQMKKSAIELYGHLPAEDFGPKAYKAVRQDMCKPAPKPKKWQGKDTRSVTYVNWLCSKLKGAWKWGVSDELVSESSYRRLLSVPDLEPGDYGLTDGKDVQPVTAELFRKTLTFLSGDCSDFLTLLWMTGARPGELIGLTPAELERDGMHLVYRPKHHKTKKKNKLRAIVFNAEGEAILKRHWPEGNTERFFAGFSCTASVRNSVYSACKRAKLPLWHPYQLRHAAVTRIALEHGKEVASAVAGHANILTTDRYDHGAVERAKRAAG